ncbi:SDR family NAD(P)-dependent oxidoreductase [Noviherbaspirillum suwonense]|uniref:NADP-dependent 3-hydroxy acid dehydrogenase YdfG n=1 Tax=Noviherbaspirillum suwonense TaxID=1224511 RepID=A0ABY1QBI7_9BURK|nr:SDR family NAD(P)-dependent oxidoreductase [Noviherbaspirillum suwonense]SMP62027.1 NADP-dependent 3-hydroxy acid dehydrogenase YdfG [Noviherbaspirillum suwonense]
MNWENKVVVVTGACGNLGQAVAALFRQAGASLVLLDLDRQRLEAQYGSEDDRQTFAAADLLDRAEVAAAFKAATDRFGRIDVLCNLAGGFRMGPPVHETTDQDWNFLFDLNARSVLHAVHAVVPQMIAAGRGAIVNVAASAALKGAAGMGAYCASKDVVIRITEAMSAELRDKGINVNCVLPSIIDTPENRAAMPASDPSRWVAPEALAKVIAFLASDDAAAIHGAAIPVTGLS